MKRRPSPATIIASVALFFSLTGAGLAASHYLITSTRQIAPNVLRQLRQTVTVASDVPGPRGRACRSSGPTGNSRRQRRARQELRGPAGAWLRYDQHRATWPPTRTYGPARRRSMILAIPLRVFLTGLTLTGGATAKLPPGITIVVTTAAGPADHLGASERSAAARRPFGALLGSLAQGTRSALARERRPEPSIRTFCAIRPKIAAERQWCSTATLAARGRGSR